MLTLLCGPGDDPPLAAVAEALAARGHAFVHVSGRMRDVGLRWRCDAQLVGALTVGGAAGPLDAITGLYLRPDVATASAPTPLERALHVLADVTPARVVNRPAAMAANGSKPWQFAALRAHGFPVPATCVTTDPAAARAFCDAHGEVIYKSVSGVRSRVARVGPAARARLEQVRWCPTQLQQRAGGREHRVHVVGDEVFACEVLSTADDYRYPSADDAPTRLRPTRLPEAVAARCVATAASMGLALAGFDLRLDGDRAWAFEANPSPAFTCFEAPGERRVADAIARWLTRAA